MVKQFEEITTKCIQLKSLNHLDEYSECKDRKVYVTKQLEELGLSIPEKPLTDFLKYVVDKSKYYDTIMRNYETATLDRYTSFVVRNRESEGAVFDKMFTEIASETSRGIKDPGKFPFAGLPFYNGECMYLQRLDG